MFIEKCLLNKNKYNEIFLFIQYTNISYKNTFIYLYIENILYDFYDFLRCFTMLTILTTN